MARTWTPNELGALDHGLREDDLALRDTTRNFLTERVRPHLPGWYTDGAAPVRELAQEFGRLGVLGMHLTGYGCAGASPTAYGLVCAEIEAADSGLRSLVSVQGSLSMQAIHSFGSEEQKQEWLPQMAAGEAIGCFGLTEPDHGSDPAGMRTRARREGSDWVLDGTKMWISNGSVASVAVVWAQTEDGIRGFVVPTDTPGFSAPEIGGKLSLRASVTSELVLEGVRLPESAVLPGVVGLKGPLSCLTEARFGIIFGAMGAARDSLETAISYADSRVQFDRPIAGFQLTQAKLADLTADYVTGMLLALHLARLKEAGTLAPAQVSLGKLNNVRRALAIARECRSVLGANGISADYSPLRHAANLESVLTYEGTTEMHTLVVGQALTGHAAFR
ncbi:acyl-CoA dehydrogenase family protein [Ornithinimicrobium faecis]|uniref:Acyl-CoA dehydrogenase family protein n=1 Tax=Ornithinimicrobium faecis TaxID=2934158 RepID=A0ABY4YSG3_9MICO|nr:acyl-CoA dehydrogenase family protein [Ornithinimicrobium sp. HY1793]USQ79705.1 acyl-CoA dehydrogenase family protein [Ornithinimicrobium sp. HY1793]